MATVGCNQRVTVVPAVQNAAYSAGNSVGGLITFTLQRSLGGIFNDFLVKSISGQTPTLICYVFDQNPTNSTFTDKSTFTLANADQAKLICAPFSLTLVAPAQGSSTSYAENSNLIREFGDGLSDNSDIYVAIAAGGTFTPGSTTDIQVSIGVSLD